jgi:hypothetical protein
VSLIINPSGGGTKLFRDWLKNIVSILTNETEVGFFQADANFSGSITGNARAEAPFDFLPSAYVEGVMQPLEIDFIKEGLANETAGRNTPIFNLTAGIEGIGNVKDLSFADVVKILAYALGVLVGESGSDVEDCKDGLLGKEVFGVKAFQYQLPGKLISEDRFVVYIVTK